MRGWAAGRLGRLWSAASRVGLAPAPAGALAAAKSVVAAALVADTGWYLAGRKFGIRILALLCRMSLSPDSCVRQTESIFERFGATSMVFAKFVPGFASVATALAGAMRLRYAVFVLFDAVGAGLWVGE